MWFWFFQPKIVQYFAVFNEEGNNSLKVLKLLLQYCCFSVPRLPKLSFPLLGMAVSKGFINEFIKVLVQIYIIGVFGVLTLYYNNSLRQIY